MNRCLVALFVLLLPITGAPGLAIPPPPPDDVRIVRVLDGTTILVMPYGSPFKLRLACIYPPPLQQGPAALAAMAALESLLQPGTWVTLATRSKATDGAELAEIIPYGTTEPINLKLVQEGMALLDRNASALCNQNTYRDAEMIAKTRKLGLWGDSAGTDPIRQ
jgi:endonuclease YncB( thermonuclease family)